MEADSLKADNKKIWIRGQFVEVTDWQIYLADWDIWKDRAVG